ASRLAMPLIQRGDLSGARAACAYARDLARQGDDLPNGALAAALFHVTAVSAGEPGLAATLRDEAGTLAARGSYPMANFVLFASVAWDRLLRGEFEEAADTAEAWARIAGRSIALPLRELVATRAGRTSGDEPGTAI